MDLVKPRLWLDLCPVIGIEQSQESYCLPLGLELLRYFEGYRPTSAVSSEEVRPFGLKIPYSFKIKSCHVLNPRKEGSLPVYSLRLQTIERLLGAQVVRQSAIAEDTASRPVNTEKGWPAPTALYLYEARRGVGRPV